MVVGKPGEDMLILLLAVFGVLGTLSRYGLQGWVQEWFGATFPVGTLTVNLLGCLLVGLAHCTHHRFSGGIYHILYVRLRDRALVRGWPMGVRRW
jgi:fluoride ion exporter CrcB/FEX